jgi:hypothetical protein
LLQGQLATWMSIAQYGYSGSAFAYSAPSRQILKMEASNSTETLEMVIPFSMERTGAGAGGGIMILLPPRKTEEREETMNGLKPKETRRKSQQLISRKQERSPTPTFAARKRRCAALLLNRSDSEKRCEMPRCQHCSARTFNHLGKRNFIQLSSQ